MCYYGRVVVSLFQFPFLQSQDVTFRTYPYSGTVGLSELLVNLNELINFY